MTGTRIFFFSGREPTIPRGGDIDIVVLSRKLTTGDDKRAIKKALFSLLEEQKIDIILAADDSDPFVKLALQTGVKL